MMRFTVKAPASSANLGPGFDALGLALDLWNEVDIELSDSTIVHLEGPDGSLLTDRENLVLTAMNTLASEYRRELPPLTLRVRANVPVARGLGSSAAAIVAGLFAANEVLQLNLDRAALYATAWRMEGHGDNVGAAVYGGAVLAVPGMSEVIRLNGEGGRPLDAVVFIPEMTGATHAARAALPNSIPYADAVFNLATASSLAVGLVTGNIEAIAAGMHDRLHEPYRARLFPHLEPVRAAARSAGAIGASLSGAGPSVLALVTSHCVDRVAVAMEDAAKACAAPGRVLPMAVAMHGAQVVW
jgi:homoserine kinase